MQMDRRAAAGVILAAPAAAFASSGDSPKQAYFATSPASSPFGEVYTNQATALWQELAETEREIYTKIARNTKQQLTDVSARLVLPPVSSHVCARACLPVVLILSAEPNADLFLLLQIVGYIQRKDWDRARTALRLYTYETRKAMTRFTNASNDSVSSKPYAHRF